MLLLAMVGMQQVHGDKVVRVSKKDEGKTIENCDALISNDSKVILAVRVADCLPIIITDKKSRSFGIIHAGWRGLDKGIITKTIQKMTNEFSFDPKNLEVSIGPHICQKHYEVGKDVSTKFKKYPNAVLKKDGKIFLDLGLIAKEQLVGLGVNPENTKIDERCTFEDKKLYSYRRNGTDKRNLYIF